MQGCSMEEMHGEKLQGRYNKGTIDTTGSNWSLCNG